MNQVMRSEAPPSEPQLGGGVVGELDDLRDPVGETDAQKSARLIDAFYEAGRVAMQRWGGMEAFARLWGCDLGDLSRRQGRKQHKGTTCFAFRDFDAIACTDDEAAAAWLAHVAEALGYEVKKKRRKRTPEEQLAALKKQLRLKLGNMGQEMLVNAGCEDDQ